MKVSDLMLDMATGDVSEHDVDAVAAAGRIAVASAIFEAAYKIAELPEDGDFAIIQEAADAGMPTSPTEATAVACTSTKKTLDSFYDLIVATAKSIKQAATKDLNLLRTIGRKFGVTADSQSNFVTSFAVPLGKAVASQMGNGKKVEMSDNKFLKGKTALKMATSYGKGMANFLAAYGISISNVFSDSAISAEFDGSYKTKKGEPGTLKAINSYLSAGGSIINMDKAADKHGHYTGSPKADDIRDLAIGLYVLIAISDATVAACGKGAKSAALNKINSLCNEDTGNNKKLTRTIESISVDAKTWSSNLTNLTTNIKKAFTDSVYVLSENATK